MNVIMLTLFSCLENHYFRENLPSHFKFKEYCPQVFRNLRDRFGIDDQDYLVRLLGFSGEGSHFSLQMGNSLGQSCLEI